jgi:hypothetical protein
LLLQFLPQAVVFFLKLLVFGFRTIPLLFLIDQIAATCAERGAAEHRGSATARKEIAYIPKKGTRPGTLICMSAYPSIVNSPIRCGRAIPVNCIAIDLFTLYGAR